MTRTTLSPEDAEFEKEQIPEEELEINLDDLEPPVPPDGGWAWMVLIGSVVCMFFVDGLSFSFGVLLSDLQSSFECSKTKISLAGSLIVGCTLISGMFLSTFMAYQHVLMIGFIFLSVLFSGPIVSAISNKFSFRTLVIVGSLCSSCSLLACAFVYEINTFLVLFGFVTGELSPN